MLMVVIASLVIAIQLAGYQKIAISVDQKRSNIASQKEVKCFLVFQKNSKQLKIAEEFYQCQYHSHFKNMWL